jgi:membrane fusion protein, multidrug efflux system
MPEPPRPMATRRARLAGLAVLAALLAGGAAFAVHWARELRYRETSDDAFIESTLLLVSARVGGTVLEVPVEENQDVRAGDVLVRLDPADYAVRVAGARADLEAARNRMASARAAAEAAEADGRAARIELVRAEREARRVHDLFAKHAISEQELENADALRDAAAARVRAFEQRALAERAMLGNEAPVRQAEAALQQAELALSYTTLVAPVDGVVGRKTVSVGENVAVGQPLLALAADEARYVRANFKETQIGRMHAGDPVEVRVDAFPDRLWHGRVSSFSPATGAKYALIPPDNATGNFTKVVQRVPVRIELEEAAADGDGAHGVAAAADPPLAVGLSAEVIVRVDRR